MKVKNAVLTGEIFNYTDINEQSDNGPVKLTKVNNFECKQFEIQLMRVFLQ